MKRSPPPKRKKPLARTGWHKTSKVVKPKQRGAYIRKVSAKKRKADAMAKTIHAPILEANPRCWECNTLGSASNPIGIHHMAKRSHGGDVHHPCNAFVACAKCNCGVLDRSTRADKVRQLAIASMRNPEHFNRLEWHKIAGKAPTWITSADIYKVMPTLAAWNQRPFWIPGSNEKDNNHVLL